MLLVVKLSYSMVQEISAQSVDIYVLKIVIKDASSMTLTLIRRWSAEASEISCSTIILNLQSGLCSTMLTPYDGIWPEDTVDYNCSSKPSIGRVAPSCHASTSSSSFHLTSSSSNKGSCRFHQSFSV